MAAITSQAKPKRPHARVADPSRVDGVRPGRTKDCANESGVAPAGSEANAKKSPLLAVAAGLPLVLDCARGIPSALSRQS